MLISFKEIGVLAVKAEMGCAIKGASSQPFMWLVEPVYQQAPLFSTFLCVKVQVEAYLLCVQGSFSKSQEASTLTNTKSCKKAEH